MRCTLLEKIKSKVYFARATIIPAETINTIPNAVIIDGRESPKITPTIIEKRIFVYETAPTIPAFVSP